MALGVEVFALSSNSYFRSAGRDCRGRSIGAFVFIFEAEIGKLGDFNYFTSAAWL